MRLSAPGGREQLDKCLAALRDPDKLGNDSAANLMSFKETPALDEFLAMPREKMHVWTEDHEIFVSGNVEQQVRGPRHVHVLAYMVKYMAK